MAQGRRQVAIALLGIGVIAVALVSFAASAKVIEVPARGGTYIEGIAGFPQAINPILAQDDASLSIAALVFSGLTRSDEHGQFVPDLAERWAISDDSTGYTFWIRSDARWHDGQPVTAADVVYTIKTIQAPRYPGLLGPAWEGIAVEALDERTVRFDTGEEPYAPFFQLASVGLLPAHLLGEVAASDLLAHRFNSHPVGTGPFHLKEFRSQSLLLEASDTYYGQRPSLDRIIFRVYPNYKTILTALEQGDVDGVSYVAPDDLPRAWAAPNVQLYTAVLASTTILFLNTTVPPFDDLRVRRAVAHALDRAALIARVRSGQARRADSPIPPGSWAYRQDTPVYPYNLAQAQTLLDEAGWRPSDSGAAGDRVNSNGEPLHIVLLTNDRQERLSLAEAVGEQLRGAGFGVEVQALGAGGLVQDFLRPRRYQAAIYSWDFNGLDPDTYAIWHSRQRENGLNVSGFADQQMDRLLEDARRTTDLGERARLYREFQARFAQQVPSILLYYPLYTYAVSTKVRDVRLGLMAGPGDRFRNVHEWYVRTRREVQRRR